jgi:hypothetical protein
MSDDPNATAVDHGTEAVLVEFDRQTTASKPGFGALKDFIFQSDVSLVPPPMLVRGLLPFDGIAFVGGQSGAGKTFIIVDLALALATGTPFFGRDVHERVGVAIVASEGRGMLPARIEAARLNRLPDKMKLPIAWSAEIPALKTGADINRFASRLRLLDEKFRKEFLVRLGAVVFDTLAATLDLEDEDDNSEAARTMRKLRELAGLVCTRDGDNQGKSPLIMPVHHYGKSATTGLRGGSAWRAGTDILLGILADREDTAGVVKNRRLILDKTRDGVEGPIASFSLRFVRLGVDGDGEPFGACVVEPILGHSGIGAKAAAASKDNRSIRTFRDAFAEAIDANGKDILVMGTGPRVRATLVSDVRTQFNRRYATGEGEVDQRTEAARKAFKRALERLAGQFATEVQEGNEWIWRS